MADLKDFNQGLKKFEQDMENAMARATWVASGILMEEMAELASAVDHSLEDLRRLGHPYGQEKPPNEPHEDWIIHHQSGDFVSSIARVPVDVASDFITGGVKVTDRKAEWLLLGTPTMRPRAADTAAVIYQEDAVAEAYRAAHAAVHDEPAVQEGFRMDVDLRTYEHPTELPES